MSTLTVAKNVNGTSGLYNLPIDAVAYIEYSTKIDRVIVHTVDSCYYMCGTLKFWQAALEGSGYRFLLVDRTNVVNVDNIVILDDQYNIAYFESNITPNSKRCTFTKIRYNEVKKLIMSTQTRMTLDEKGAL